MIQDPDPTDRPDNATPANGIASPCVRLCVLSADGVCMGCYRTSAEIGRWAQAPTAEKLAIVDSCRARRFESAVAEPDDER